MTTFAVRLALVTLFTFTWSTSFGCGGGSSETVDTSTLPRPPERPQANIDDPVALMSPETVVLVRSDVNRLRSSPYHEQLYGLLTRLANEERVPEAAQRMFRQAYDHTQVAAVGMASIDGGQTLEDPVVVTKGTYGQGELGQHLRELAASEHANVTETQTRGHATFAIEEMRAVDVESRGWIVGAASELEPTMGRAYGEIASMRTQGRLLDITRRSGIENATVGVAFEMVPAVRHDIGPVPGADLVTRGGVRVDVENGLVAVGLLETASAQAAAQLAQTIQGTFQEIAGEIMLMPTPIPSILRSAVIQIDGANVSVTLQSNDDQTRTLLSLASTFLEAF